MPETVIWQSPLAEIQETICNGAAEALGYASVDALQNAIMEFCEG